MRRILTLGLLAVATLVVAVWLLFPIDDLVRTVVEGIGTTPVGRPTFTRAVLRPWGVQIDGLALERDGVRRVVADWLVVRPTWRGIASLTGRPVHVAAGLCRGEVTVVGDVDGSGPTQVDASWRGVQLEHCPLPPPFDTLRGTLEGTTALARQSGRATWKGDGRFALAAARLPFGGRIPGVDELNLERFATDWTLTGDDLALHGIAVTTPEVAGQGDGNIRLRANLGDSGLRLRLTMQPQPYAPAVLRALLESLPRAAGEPNARLVIVEGTVGNPELVRHE